MRKEFSVPPGHLLDGGEPFDFLLRTWGLRRVHKEKAQRLLSLVENTICRKLTRAKSSSSSRRILVLSLSKHLLLADDADRARREPEPSTERQMMI